MVITNICGNLSDPAFRGKRVDALWLDDVEAQKRILRKNTEGGRDIALRLEAGAQLRGLRDGDVLAEDAGTVVAVRLLPVPALLVRTAAAAEIARLCYEIGNRHAPLYAPDGTFSCFALRYDASLEQLIRQLGLAYEKKDMVLSRVDQLKLLSPHHHHHQNGDT